MRNANLDNLIRNAIGKWDGRAYTVDSVVEYEGELYVATADIAEGVDPGTPFTPPATHEIWRQITSSDGAAIPGIVNYVDAAYTAGDFVFANGCIYEATADVAVGDEAPDISTTSPWQRVAGTRVSTIDTQINPQEGDIHFYSEPGQGYPRTVIYFNGAWLDRFTGIQIKDSASSFNYNLGAVIGYEKGTTADPKGALYLHSMEDGLDNSYKIDKLWGTAWGYIGHVNIPGAAMSAGSDHGLFTSRVVKGRRYKITVSLPVGCGALRDRTKLHAHLYLDGWIGSGEWGGYWHSAADYSSNQRLDHIHITHVFNATANKGVVIKVNVTSDTSDSRVFPGEILLEDIGPTTR